jgi:hypothetical protein
MIVCNAAKGVAATACDHRRGAKKRQLQGGVMCPHLSRIWIRPALVALGLLSIYGAVTWAEPPSPAQPARDPALQPAPQQAISYEGSFTDGKITVDLKAVEIAKYTGTVTMGDQKFPLVAADTGQGLQGTFESKGKQFAFTATLTTDKLFFQTGRSQYTLTRVPVQENPLDKPGTPDNPLDQPKTPAPPVKEPAKEPGREPQPPVKEPTPPPTEQPPQLIGVWSGAMKGGGVIIPVTIAFRADGHYVLRTQQGPVQEGKWTATADSLTQMPDDGMAERHPYEIQGNVLTITAATGTMRLSKVGG